MSATPLHDRTSTPAAGGPDEATSPSPRAAPVLAEEAATTYAQWFATLADPTRVRVLHAVATSGGQVAVGALAARVGIAQSTCSHHLRLLAEGGFVVLERSGTSTIVSVDESCCSGLPHAADVVMGTLDALPCCPDDVPDDVTVVPLQDAHWDDVARIYAEGMATGLATFDTEVPGPSVWDGRWLAGHRHVALLDGEVVGWASLSPVSPRACYAGVAEDQVYVASAARGRGVGTALIDALVRGADEAGLWTVQAQVFPENRASLRLHRSAGFRTVGVRERIGQLDGEWRDTVLLERRR